jgi:actin-related protein
MTANSIILDAGSYKTKGGPRTDPCMVSFYTLTAQDGSIGTEALAYNDISQLLRPIQNGLIVDWEQMELIYDHFFSMLNSPKNFSLIDVVQPLNLKSERKKKLEFFFEKYHANSVIFANSAAMSLYHVSKISGITIQIGYETTIITPVNQSVVLPQVRMIPFGGKHLIQMIQYHLKNRGIDIDFPIASDIMESMCFMQREDPSRSPFEHPRYELPDGSSIKLGEELFRYPELLFKPQKLSLRQKLLYNISESFNTGIVDIIKECINDMDQYMREKMFGGVTQNIVLCGGTSCIRDLPVYLNIELEEALPFKFRLRAEHDRKNAPVTGAGVLSLLTFSQDLAISKQEYEEYGSCMVFRKSLIA